MADKHLAIGAAGTAVAAVAPPSAPVRGTAAAPPRSTATESDGDHGSGFGRGTPRPASHAHGSMPVAENLRVALMGLAANKLRAALTMLGIIIGVGAVITMVALGQGAREKTLAQIRAMGTNLLLAEPEMNRIGAVRGRAGSWNRLKVQDLEAITPDTCPDVQAVSPDMSTRWPMFTQVKAGNQNTNTNVASVWPSWVEIRNYKMAMGRFFTTEEEKKRAKVVVLGWAVYQQLFPDGGDPTGKLLRVNNVGLRCLGVMAPKGQAGAFNPDDLIAVPSSTAQKRLFNWWMGRPRAFAAQAVSEEKMGDAAAQIDALFRKRYKVRPGDPSTIGIKNQSEIASFAEESQNTFTALLAGIAGVSLVVGGIGIMNIMLVSVTERTREIGLRKAIGAKRRDVLLQFLIEAVTLSILGGIVGILIGIGVALTLPKLVPDTAAVITIPPMVLAFAFSAAVGIFFGFYPAQKAAKLDPIIALRYE